METIDCVRGKLKFDEACVSLKTSNSQSNLWLYSLSSDCVSCPYTRIAPILKSTTSVKFNTVRSMQWRVLDVQHADEYVSAKNTSPVTCELIPNIKQFGVYDLSVENRNCNLQTVHVSTSQYTELFVTIGAIIIMLLALSGVRSTWHILKKKFSKKQVDEAMPKEQTKRRVKAIDTFRGASTLFMIFVNDGSGGYPILGHATWNGLLIGDLVFPCFIWIMGVCIPIALSSQIKRMTPKRTITYTIVKRSILLFLIGVALNTVYSGPQLERLRIFGVLQRFGISYLFVALIFLYLIPEKSKKPQTPFSRSIQDIIVLLPQWLAMIVIAVIHCVLTFSLRVPDCPTGYLGPGGRHDDGEYFNCTGGSAGYIDNIILTGNHIYQRPLISTVYGSGPFDPEGILGCLTSIFQVFLGVQAGVIMMTYKDWKERVIRWLLWAAFFGCVGCVLHFSGVIPVNKNLWSLSFVFVTTCFALAFFSGCFILVDVLKVWRGGPFRIPGMNALVLYVGHSLCYKVFPFHWKIGDMDSRYSQLIEAIWGVALWAVVAYIMHRKRTYISL